MTRWPSHLLWRISERITARVDALPMDPDAKNRLYHFTAFLFLGIPAMLAFGVYNLLAAHPLLGTVNIAMALSTLLAWNLLSTARSGLLLYRVNIGCFTVMLLYMLALGGGAGSKALWLYTFPLVAFFLLGTREGLAWTVALLLGAAGIFSVAPRWPAVYRYDGEFTSRFGASFLIVAVIAYWFEHLRQHYRKGMEAEHQRLLAEGAALQAALSKVKQLSGMLPICAACKKVRDDQGYWRQLEVYIRDHSEAEFSHSLCPDCGEHLYPGVYRKPGTPT